MIALDGTADRVRLTVTDDGRGAFTDDGRGPAVVGGVSPGSGLQGLRERVAAAGGTLESGPAPQGGFRVTAELPVETPGPHEGEPTT